MINEALYCERLMYLEWAQGEFADNAFTVEGRYVHNRADTPGGKLPPQPAPAEEEREDASEADEESPPYEARSVWLSSERFGITAKIDIVEGDQRGTVVPIEYKRGKAPDVPGGAYMPERAQICAQALVLRDHGYVCDEGAIYFAKSRKRVAVPITQNLIAVTMSAVVRAREVVAAPEPPPPLVDSPKCRGCSLAGICLPDEVNLLRRLRGEPIPEPPDEEAELRAPLDPDPWGLATPPTETAGAVPAKSSALRQLHATRDDRVPLYVQDPRAQIGLSGERLVIRGADGAAHARLMNTSHVVLLGNAQISTQAMRALLVRGIPVSFCTSGGWLVGRAIGSESNNVELRLAQYRRASDPQYCVRLAGQIVASKAKNCRTMLRRNHASPDPVALGQLKQLARKANEASSLESLLGIEGSAARVYFQAFGGMLTSRGVAETFRFETRNRRPPRDPINALLSFAYALLTKDFSQTVSAVGLDPLLGFYHQPRFGRPALALDLMEEFRPLIADSVVVAAVNTRVVSDDDFVITGDACSLKDAARRRVIDAYERRMDQQIVHPLFGYRVSYRRIIEIQARLLARHLSGEIEAYPSFRTR
jgi:CRISPR-associated protein Cas1